MFRRKTVFVLGAGVSQSYGFMGGSQIVEYLKNSNGQRELAGNSALIATGAGTDEICRLSDEVRKAMPRSIDAFLEHRAEFQNIGRLILALLIGRCESSGVFDASNNCLEPIIHKMTTGCKPDDVSTNQVAFITFNYDRSLEHFLYSVLTARYGLKNDEAANWLRRASHSPHVWTTWISKLAGEDAERPLLAARSF